MKPLAIDTMVEYRGRLWFVAFVVSEGENPCYIIRNTIVDGLAKIYRFAHHHELTVKGGVL